MCRWRDAHTRPYTGDYKFEKLSLTEDVDISVYEDAIDFAFANPDVKNIAISGAYGSGKSSVLASYKKKHPKKKFLHISLAHFKASKPQEVSTGDGSGGEGTATAALEGKILNQLIHQLDTKDIPQTNFRVKNTVSLWTVVWNTLAITAAITCFLHLVLSYTWIDFVSTFAESDFKNLLERFTTPISFFHSGCVVFSICAFYIYSAVKAQRYKAAIRKLSLQGNEIELFEEDNDSFFDKYLNEVLYLFENSDVDAIVFEDMDRYEMEAIFERLREVNTLINIRLAQKSKRIIRFVFLLRDDIFVSKDRTKFFDYIIPIVPVIDASNSYDQLTEHLKRNKIRQDFSDAFLQGISLYIDDMRLLKNICNEYLIYQSRLGAIKLDPEKLLAIITYKNIFPRDFGQLQNNLGYVHAVFAQKPQIIDTQISTLESECKRLNALADSAVAEALATKIEIMQIYVIRHVTYVYSHTLRNMSEAELEAKLRGVLSGQMLDEYNARVKQIEYSSAQKQSELLYECKQIERKILAIKGMRLHEIIPHEEGANILSQITYFEEGAQQDYKEIKESQYFDLLKYLILNGYLDESYPDYMTYFYPHSLTRKDKIFLRRVLDRNGHDYTYGLDNPQLVASKLRVSDFDYDEVLNNDLVNHLLKRDFHSEKLQHLLAQLEKNRNFHFIRQFLELTTEKERFVQALNKQWPGFFDDIVRKRELTPQEIRQYSIDTLHYCKEEQLVSVNVGNSLAEYISNSPDYLQILNPKVEKLISAFTLLGVRFQTINPEVSDRILFERVYQGSLYCINMGNIILMLRFVHRVADDEEKLLSRNYSYLCRFPESPLYQYIESHIDDYMGMWLTTHHEEFDDQECWATKLLNNPEVSERFKEGYIEKLDTVISSLQNIQDKNLWRLLLERKRVSYVEENIIAYWSTQNKLDSTVIRYINEFQGAIDLSVCLRSVSEAVMKEFYISLVKCNDIRNRQYHDCVVSLGFKWDEEFNIFDLSIDKVKILAKNHILQMTPATLRFLRSNYSDAIPVYIESNFDEYMSIMTAQLMNQNELLMILDWDVGDDAKKKLIDMAPSQISIVGKKYSPEVSAYILQKKPHANDIPQLYTSYDSQPDLVKEYIYSYAIRNIDAIIRDTIKTTNELKCRILEDTQIADSVKHRLLLTVVKTCSPDNAKRCFDAANKKEFSKIIYTRKKPKIDKDTQSKELLDALKAKGWIAGFSLNQTGDGYDVQRHTQTKRKELIPT